MDLAAGIGSVDPGLFAVINIAVLISAILVFMMQPGFMLLEVGLVSRLNAINDIYKNLLDTCAGALAFYVIGWDVLTGQSSLTPLLVSAGFANPPPEVAVETLQPSASMAFVFQLAFATTAATICSGAVTGRIRPHAYLVFAALFTGLIYPLIAFSVWHPQGLLFGRFYDFAGSVVVHAAGAAAGLAGSVLLRPRIGYNGYDPLNLGREQLFRLAKRHAPHNLPIAALGAFLLWIGWFGFNGGALFIGGAEAASVEDADGVAALFARLGDVFAATVIAPAAAALTVSAIHVFLKEDRSLMDALNALIAGAVAVTAGAALYTPGEAALVGVGAALVFRLARAAFERTNIDDPVHAIAAHGFTGVFGVAAVGFVGPDAGVETALLQAAFGLAVFLWIFLLSLVGFGLVGLGARLVGRSDHGDAPRPRSGLRLAYRIEINGVDAELHGQSAYGSDAKD